MLRADQALTSARDASRLAHRAQELATIAYRAGATTNIEVLDADRASPRRRHRGRPGRGPVPAGAARPAGGERSVPVKRPRYGTAWSRTIDRPQPMPKEATTEGT